MTLPPLPMSFVRCRIPGMLDPGCRRSMARHVENAGTLVWFDEGASFRKAPGGGKKIRDRW